MIRLGYELSFAKTMIKPSDLKNPDRSRYETMSSLERLFLRIFGIPDTIKQQQARKVFSLLKNLSFNSVLDLGCSFGHYSIRIAKEYPQCRVLGIDVNEEQLNIGRSIKEILNLKNLTFESKDVCIEKLDGNYDLVLLLQVLEHLRNDDEVLRKINKVLNDGGRLIITAPNIDSPIISWSKRYVAIAGHYHEGYTLNQLVDKLVRLNYKVENCEYLSGPLGQLIEKIETLIKISSTVLFALVYPILNFLVRLDDFIMPRTANLGSGILIVASKPK